MTIVTSHPNGVPSWIDLATPDLITPDPASVEAFYAEVLGWSAQAVPMPGMPPYWGVYFHSDGPAETVAVAKQHGAQVLMEPTPMPGVGTLATITDPQGAVFSVIRPEG